jgi:general secretion pathway protein M
MTVDLPTGRRGRALAVALGLLVLVLLWFGIASPLLGWYSDRAEALAQREMLASRMARLARRLPALEREAGNLRAGEPGPDALLPGQSDAVAAAALQERVHALASQAGTVLLSVEILPAEQIGQFRRIGLRLSLQADLTHFVGLMRLFEQARPRILVSDLEVQRRQFFVPASSADLDTKFTAYALRVGMEAEGK